MLLRYDACASIINGTAQIPRNLTEDDEIITMLEGMERGRGGGAGGGFLQGDPLGRHDDGPERRRPGAPPPRVQEERIRLRLL